MLAPVAGDAGERLVLRDLVAMVDLAVIDAAGVDVELRRRDI